MIKPIVDIHFNKYIYETMHKSVFINTIFTEMKKYFKIYTYDGKFSEINLRSEKRR